MVVHGGSQGGALALVAAALFPQIKKAAVMFPFLSDFRGAYNAGVTGTAYEELKYIFRFYDPQHKKEEEYFRKLAARKRSLSAIDYNDLEEFGTKLFLNDDGTVTETAKEVGGKYDWIFIDEYQDTNRVQDRIFCAVSGNASRFIVGDIKQSIYRFRGANPEVFAEYRRSCITVGKKISVVRGDEIRHGTALDVDAEGALIVEFDDKTVAAVNSGEVSIRGMYGYI
jgi:hypothetical protein